MGGTTISPEAVQEVVKFHGHSCPGLAIGIRVCEAMMAEFGDKRSKDEELVAVLEVNMCGVDAIQALTGCTYGKGNLIFLDHGKRAFSFYRRSDGKSMRIMIKPGLFDKLADGFMPLKKKQAKEGLSAEEQQRLREILTGRVKYVMEADLSDILTVGEVIRPVPAEARVVGEVTCEVCGESLMETRMRRLLGKTMCITCFEAAGGQ